MPANHLTVAKLTAQLIIRRTRFNFDARLVQDLDPDSEMVRAKEEELAAPVATVEEKWKLLPEFLRMRGLMRQHIDSFNHFMNIEMNNIVTAESNQIIRSEADPTYYIKYLKVEVKYPIVHGDHGVGDIAITPFECRLRDFTYSAPIVLSISSTPDK